MTYVIAHLPIYIVLGKGSDARRTNQIAFHLDEYNRVMVKKNMFVKSKEGIEAYMFGRYGVRYVKDVEVVK